ncbi:MAG: VOC family protein [bacterium]|nr:VOC family protein [bacterium]
MKSLRLDHIVYAVPDLPAAVDDLEKRLGVRPSAGGKHEGLGTHNALLALSEDAYLEVVGPDSEQPEPANPRPFGIDSLTSARIVTWAARSEDLDASIAQAKRAGFDTGLVLPLSRRTPEGALLEWRLTIRSEFAGDGLVPFLIDWGTTPHPASAAASGCKLVGLRAEHPEPAQVLADLEALGASLPVQRAARAVLVVELETPAGRVQLR